MGVKREEHGHWACFVANAPYVSVTAEWFSIVLDARLPKTIETRVFRIVINPFWVRVEVGVFRDCAQVGWAMNIGEPVGAPRTSTRNCDERIRTADPRG